jgi:hypothetical protein
MSESIIDSLFEEIKEGYNAPTNNGGGLFKDILRFQKGNDYVVRLLPNIKKPKESKLQIDFHGWQSKSTGKYVEFMDPSMVDLPNPIKAYSYDLTDKMRELKLDKSDPRMIRARSIWTKKNWLFNCYVVDDPVNPENNGTVKILRVGPQIFEGVIDEAISGDRKDDFGIHRVFNPEATGCNLKIRAVDTGKPGKFSKDYSKSYFMTPSEITGVSGNNDKIKDILEQCFDLSTIFPIKSYDELKEALQTHFIGDDDMLNSTVSSAEPMGEPMGEVSAPVTEASEDTSMDSVGALIDEVNDDPAPTETSSAPAADSSGNIDIDNILEGL